MLGLAVSPLLVSVIGLLSDYCCQIEVWLSGSVAQWKGTSPQCFEPWQRLFVDSERHDKFVLHSCHDKFVLHSSRNAAGGGGGVRGGSNCAFSFTQKSILSFIFLNILVFYF